jgi:hypothetical protein
MGENAKIYTTRGQQIRTASKRHIGQDKKKLWAEIRTLQEAHYIICFDDYFYFAINVV